MDKYELIEVLRAAADGIAGATKSKEAELKLDDFRKLIYNLCKFVITQEELYFSSPNTSHPFYETDPLKKIYLYVSKFDQMVSDSTFTGKELLGKVSSLYKALTNEDPPKED